MREFLHFLKYHNAVPIAFSVLMLGTVSTYAYNNPEVIIDKEERVISIDNSYIADVNLDRFTPTVTIISVTEDETKYYIEYDFSTITLIDYVWQDVTTRETLEILKSRLEKYRDLGLFVTEELNERIQSEKKRLVETQTIEKNQRSQKRVVTEYKGIVGGFLSEKVTAIDRYKPVIKPPKERQEVATFARPAVVSPQAKPVREKPDEPTTETIKDVVVALKTEPTDTDELLPGTVAGAASTSPKASTTPPKATTTTEKASTTDSASSTGGSGGSGSSAPANEAPTLSILGDNPVELLVGDSYTDLGAAVTDDHDEAITVNLYLDGEAVFDISIDTTAATTYSIVYEATDSEGLSSQVERIVRVSEPSRPPETPKPAEAKASSSPQLATTQPVNEEPALEEPAVEPEPEPAPEVVQEAPAPESPPEDGIE